MYIYILLHGTVSIKDTRSYKGLLNINILQNMDCCSHFLLVCRKCIFSPEIIIVVLCFAQFTTCFVTARLVANHLSLCNAFIINGARKKMFILFSYRKLDFRKNWTVKTCTFDWLESHCLRWKCMIICEFLHGRLAVLSKHYLMN